MSLPTQSEVYMRMLERIRLASEDAATMAHLINLQYEANPSPMDKTLAHGWLGIHELLLRMTSQITKLAKGTLQ